MKTEPETVDGYLASLGPAERKTLEELRRLIRRTVPEAEECLSYGVPAFRLDGELLAGFSASKKFCSYYPMSGSVIKTLTKALAAFETTKGSIHFSAKDPLPVRLVERLLRVRIAELKR